MLRDVFARPLLERGAVFLVRAFEVQTLAGMTCAELEPAVFDTLNFPMLVRLAVARPLDNPGAVIFLGCGNV